VTSRLPSPAIIAEYAQKCVEFGVCAPEQSEEMTRMLTGMFREGYVYCLEVEAIRGHGFAILEGQRLLGKLKP